MALMFFLDEEDRAPAPPEATWPARESEDHRLLRYYVDRHTRFNPVLARFIADLTGEGATAECRALAVLLYKAGELQLDQLFIKPR